MFHQICLLPQDKALLHFLWHGLNREASPSVYEWQVLHFGTTCSPCCAIYALQRLVQDAQAGEDIAHSVNNCFYVDNCLQSLPTAESAKSLIENLRIILALGGFEIICATSFLLLLELRLLFGICGTKHVIGMTPTYLMSS